MEETRLRVELEDYVGEVFASLGRKDQRAKGRLYLQGLMLEGRRKSMQPMAGRLDVDHQQLQQFVTSSPWKVEPVRRRLAALAEEAIAPEAWVIDDTGFKKDGVASACVARQYSGTLGKIGNCQVAATVHMVTDAASAPVNWRLFVPEAWDDTCADTNEQAEAVAARRAKARIPDYVRNRPKWELALEMIDELTRWGRTCPVAVADAGYGDNALFRLELTRRSIPWVMAVKASTSAYPADTVPELAERSGPRGRPSVPRYRQAPASLAELAVTAGRRELHQVTWRHGTKNTGTNKTAAMKSRFLALRVRPASRHIAPDEDGSLPEAWLIAEWPPGAKEPTDYWLSDLPANTPARTLVRLAKIRWRIEHDYRELKTGLGLSHFEGRSFPGFHHHATLVSAAHLFITRKRLATPKATGAA
jgi:SRSO17 transposase